jgi:hypothetical protein
MSTCFNSPDRLPVNSVNVHVELRRARIPDDDWLSAMATLLMALLLIIEVNGGS